jgi:rhodanese-related sulfurtransferase
MFSDQPSEISLDELRATLASPNPPRVAEILGPHQFARGHLPGAVNLPLENMLERAAQVLPDKSAPIVVYCASSSCQNSELAQRKLQSLGYQNVRVFRGGKAAWEQAGLLLSAA